MSPSPRPVSPADRPAPTVPGASPDHTLAPGEVPEPESALEALGKAITAPIRGAADDNEDAAPPA